jgi:hypothetical protein
MEEQRAVSENGNVRVYDEIKRQRREDAKKERD